MAVGTGCEGAAGAVFGKKDVAGEGERRAVDRREMDGSMKEHTVDIEAEIMAQERRSWTVMADGCPPAQATAAAPEKNEEAVMIAELEQSTKAKKQAAYWAKMSPEERRAEQLRRRETARARRAGEAVAEPVARRGKKAATVAAEAVVDSPVSGAGRAECEGGPLTTLPEASISLDLVNRMELVATMLEADLRSVKRTIALMRSRMAGWQA